MIGNRERKTHTSNPDVENEADNDTSTGGVRNVEQELASGRPGSTPFALTGIVALVVWSVAALVAAVLFLVIWLA
jgi:hypothetical protein